MGVYEEIVAVRKRVENLERIEQPARSGGLPVYPTLTAGSVIFAGTGGVLAQNNSNLSWDNINNILSINGIQFPVATGTFTPSYQGTGTAGTWVYSVQTGFYTRIANRCFFNLSVAVSSRSVAPTGAARIIGLPFTSDATANSHSPVAIDTIDAFTLSGTNTQLTARVPPSAAYIELVEVLGTGPTVASQMGATGFGTASFIRMSGHYMI